MRFLLDTNVISEIRKRDRAHPNVARWVTRTPVSEIGTSVLVLAKTRRGIELPIHQRHVFIPDIRIPEEPPDLPLVHSTEDQATKHL